jgi:predicted DNA-binding transcriptional regulator AlpA
MSNQRLSKKDILKMYEIERTTLYKWIQQGKFPKPSIYISTHKCYWLSEDIDNFIKSKQK